MNKFIKTLIIINGLLLPTIVGVFIYKNYISKPPDVDILEPDGLIVGEKLEKAKKDSLALQGIFYDAPEQIYNSTNYYLPVSVMTYEQARDYKKLSESAGDFSFSSYYTDINVIFLDKNYNVITQLVNKKASISKIYVNYRDDKTIDKTALNIAYLISFVDSNGDGKLDANDNHDLYISDLDGKNLIQVTNNKKIEDFTFINSNSEIFIEFKERKNIRDEYKRLKFGIYKIKDSTWVELSQLEEKLKEIEKTLNK